MYKVFFAGLGSSPMVQIASVPEITSACEFAIALHRSSNTPHRVFVINDATEVLTLTLEPKDESKSNS